MNSVFKCVQPGAAGVRGNSLAGPVSEDDVEIIPGDCQARRELQHPITRKDIEDLTPRSAYMEWESSRH